MLKYVLDFMGILIKETYGLDFGAEDSPPISKLYGDSINMEVKNNG